VVAEHKKKRSRMRNLAEAKALNGESKSRLRRRLRAKGALWLGLPAAGSSRGADRLWKRTFRLNEARKTCEKTACSVTFTLS
jgi:hypothetical protein